MKRLQEIGARLTRDAQLRRAARIAAAFRERLPGARIEVDGGRVAISARDLVRRWLGDSALRFIGRTPR